MSRRTILGGLVMFSLFCLPLPAGAGLVTFAFSGQVTSVRDDTGVLGGGVNVGDAFSGFYTFESETSDGRPDNPDHGFYLGIVEYGGAVGNAELVFVSSGAGESLISVVLANDIVAWDTYAAGAPVVIAGQSAATNMALFDDSGSALLDDSLPLTPPSLDAFNEANFILDSTSKDFAIRGEVTSLTLVPEPGTLLLLGVGAAFVTRRRRTSTRQRRSHHWSAPVRSTGTLIMSRRTILGGLVMFSLFCLPLPAGAGLVTFAFSGQITSVRDNTGVLGGGVNVGDPFSGFYTFESETQDFRIANPTNGLYLGVTSYSGQVGTVPFAGESETGQFGNAISILLADEGLAYDSYGASATVRMADEIAVGSISLIDESGTALSDDSLPLVPPALADFDEAVFLVDAVSKDFSVRGEVTSLTLVPEPGTLLLLVIGVTIMQKRRGVSCIVGLLLFGPTGTLIVSSRTILGGLVMFS